MSPGGRAEGDDAGRAETAAREERLARLLRAHAGAVLGVALRATGDRAAAEDVAQETWFRAWQHPDVLELPEAAARSWLCTVARHVATDRWRHADAERRALERSARASGDASVPDGTEGLADRELLERALEQLPLAQREVLELTALERRCVAQAATLLGIPEGTVKSRTYYALRELRRSLVELGWQP